MNWNDIKKSVGNFADKATKKTEEIADLAAIKLKMAKLSSDKENEFLRLGKLTYKKLTAADDTKNKELAEKISESVNKISDLSDEISGLKLEYQLKKQESEAKKKAKKAKDDDIDGGELDTTVLDSFSDSAQ